jgi:hypothetical protein
MDSLYSDHESRVAEYRAALRKPGAIACLRRYRWLVSKACESVPFNEPTDRVYFQRRIARERVAAVVLTDARPQEVRKLADSQVRYQKHQIYEANRPRFDLSSSELIGIIGLISTLFIVLGYVRIEIILGFLGIPYEQYFGLDDYVASSMRTTPMQVFSAITTVVTSYANIDEIITPAYPNNNKRTLLTLFLVSLVLFLIPMAFFVFDIVKNHNFNSLGIATAVTLFAAPISAFLSMRYSANPKRHYAAIAFVIFASLQTIIYSIGDAFSATQPPNTAHLEEIDFADGTTFSTQNWAVMAATSRYYIFRNRQSGEISVRPANSMLHATIR